VSSATKDSHGEITGASRLERAICLSGVLAEQGIRELVISTIPGESRVLLARITDLPTELGSAPVVRLNCTNPPFSVVVNDDRLTWQTSDEPLARALRSA